MFLLNLSKKSAKADFPSFWGHVSIKSADIFMPLIHYIIILLGPQQLCFNQVSKTEPTKHTNSSGFLFCVTSIFHREDSPLYLCYHTAGKHLPREPKGGKESLSSSGKTQNCWLWAHLSQGTDSGLNSVNFAKCPSRTEGKHSFSSCASSLQEQNCLLAFKNCIPLDLTKSFPISKGSPMIQAHPLACLELFKKQAHFIV